LRGGCIPLDPAPALKPVFSEEPALNAGEDPALKAGDIPAPPKANGEEEGAGDCVVANLNGAPLGAAAEAKLNVGGVGAVVVGSCANGLLVGALVGMLKPLVCGTGTFIPNAFEGGAPKVEAVDCAPNWKVGAAGAGVGTILAAGGILNGSG